MAADLLFIGSYLSDALDAQNNKVQSAIDQEKPDYICTVNEERYIEHLVENYKVTPLQLHVDETTMSPPKEKTVPIQSYGHSHHRKITTIEFSVPFSGDKELFKLQPNRFTSNPPRETIRNNEVIFEVEQCGDAEKVKGALNHRIQNIQEYIGYQGSQIEKWNSELPRKVSSAFEARKAKLIADNKVVSALGFPLKTGPANTAYSATFRKKVEVQRPTGGKPVASPHPFLREENFQEILKALREMEMFMERSPTTFHGLGEEAIRDHFLLVLNGRFEGSATAETFNFKGKTDILLQQEKRNVFIAECKIWKGDKAFLAAIDQLLGYLTWQDTKAAILVFVRDTKITTVTSKIPELLSTHPNFVAQVATDYESEFRAKMKNATDNGIQIHLVVQVYHVPSVK
jgi:hypothetical protein